MSKEEEEFPFGELEVIEWDKYAHAAVYARMRFIGMAYHMLKQAEKEDDAPTVNGYLEMAMKAFMAANTMSVEEFKELKEQLKTRKVVDD